MRPAVPGDVSRGGNADAFHVGSNSCLLEWEASNQDYRHLWPWPQVCPGIRDALANKICAAAHKLNRLPL